MGVPPNRVAAWSGAAFVDEKAALPYGCSSVGGFLRHAPIIALRAAAYFAIDDLNLVVVLVIRSHAESVPLWVERQRATPERSRMAGSVADLFLDPRVFAEV